MLLPYLRNKTESRLCVFGCWGRGGGDTNLRVSNPQIKPNRVGAAYSFGRWQTNLEFISWPGHKIF